MCLPDILPFRFRTKMCVCVWCGVCVCVYVCVCVCISHLHTPVPVSCKSSFIGHYRIVMTECIKFGSIFLVWIVLTLTDASTEYEYK
jgi:hypothetical protein